MRALTKAETDKLKLLTEKSVSFTLIEPTATGLCKSIMDATGPVRTYLLEQGVHNFTLQKQGQEHKIQVKSLLLESTVVLPSICSLYRPVTKKGDPRIWFKGLPDYVEPNDILAIIVHEGVLYVANITRLNIARLLTDIGSNPLKELVGEIYKDENAIANELLLKLRKIATGPPVPAEVDADTAVGRTLESLLDLRINSSKAPDYKGIEIKSYRDKRDNRKNLFAQVPNWSLSKFKSSREILDAVGYSRPNQFKLYCTVNALKRNSQGLILKLDKVMSCLVENSDKHGAGDIVVWSLMTLHKRLLEKHNETFWVAADSVKVGGREHFVYTKAEHTQNPIPSQFDLLLELGAITMDHLIKRSSNGKVVEKGPLFKIRPKSLGMLFPPSTIYQLR